MFSILQMILAAGALVLIGLVVLTMLAAAGSNSVELEYCAKHQICYKFNMLLCTDETCPGRHICKYCHSKTNREFKHASNDTDRCGRMSRTYRLSLEKVGSGKAPDGYYNHLNEGFVSSTASTQPLPGTSSGMTQQQSFSCSGSTRPFHQSAAGSTHPFQTAPHSNQVLSERLAESERARHSLANDVRRLEGDNEELIQENIRLTLELEKAKAREESSRLKGKVAPRIRDVYLDRDCNPSNNQRSVDLSSFPQVPRFTANVASNQVNPGGDRNRGNSVDFSSFPQVPTFVPNVSSNQVNLAAGDINREGNHDFATYAYSNDPNRTDDGFPYLGSENTGRGRSGILGGGWFHPE